MGYLRWAPNITGEKILTTNAAAGDRTRAAGLSPTIHHVAIKADLYRKAVQLCYIHIPCENKLHFRLYSEYMNDFRIPVKNPDVFHEYVLEGVGILSNCMDLYSIRSCVSNKQVLEKLKVLIY